MGKNNDFVEADKIYATLCHAKEIFYRYWLFENDNEV